MLLSCGGRQMERGAQAVVQAVELTGGGAQQNAHDLYAHTTEPPFQAKFSSFCSHTNIWMGYLSEATMHYAGGIIKNLMDIHLKNGLKLLILNHTFKKAEIII